MRSVVVIVLSVVLLTACSKAQYLPQYSTVDPNGAGYTNTQRAVDIHLQLGFAYLKKGDRVRAKKHLRYAQILDPSDPMVECSLGFFFETLGDLRQAEPHYLHAIALAPNNGVVHNNYGTFLCRHGRARDSLHQFTLALQDVNTMDKSAVLDNIQQCATKK